MFRIVLAFISVALLYACAAPQPVPSDSRKTIKTYTLPAGANKKLTFKTNGCLIGEGTLQNDADHASAGAYGTLTVANSKHNTVVDQYRVSCPAIPVKGTASCVIQRVQIQGTGTDKDFGGPNCPDMKFQLVNFRSF